MPSGVGGALAGFGFLGPDGQGWKAVPIFCLLGVLGGAGLWAVARKSAPARATPRAAPARPQTFLEQLLDLCLLLLVAPMVAVAIGLGVMGGIAVLVRLLD